MATTVSTLMLFGATGDLAMRMLLPSLCALDCDGLLPADLKIIGTARAPLNDEAYRNLAGQALADFLPDGLGQRPSVERFLNRLSFVPLDIADRRGFAALRDSIAEPERGVAIYLSTAPSMFERAIEGLRLAGLTNERVRIALEKPLGTDLATSRRINDSAASAFPEGRTFRIDHYLGKETVQNLLALRFANAMFEPLWTGRHIDHVQITVAETVGLENRGQYYDSTGALRDMVQNHMLQLLALVAMEVPTDYQPTAIQDEKVKILRSLRPIRPVEARQMSVLGQYAGKTDADSYIRELGCHSSTETFVALKAHIDNWRWAGVPFYLRSGKRMAERRTEVVVQFKDVPHSIFERRGGAALANKLVISLQPEESIRLLMMAKTPGLDRDGIRLRQLSLDLSLANAFSGNRRRIAYERLLLDFIEGDLTLFVRRDEVEAQWKWIDGIRSAWTETGIVPEPYAPGSWGPQSSSALIAGEGRQWHSTDDAPDEAQRNSLETAAP